MSASVCLEQYKKVLNSQNVSYREIALEDGYTLIVIEDCGRLIGPFGPQNEHSLGWISSQTETPEKLNAFIKEHQWNWGGARIWVAPEFPFTVKDRTRFSETGTVQDSYDPAHYAASEDLDGNLVLEAKVGGELFEHKYKEKYLKVSRTVSPCDNPLRRLKSFADIMKDVKYCGFSHYVTMKDLTPEEPMDLAVWSFNLFPAGGKYLIPYLGGELDYVDFYNPSFETVLYDRGSFAEITVNDNVEHKIGIKSDITFGRYGYIRKLEDEKYCLCICNYFNDPSDLNIKEPPYQPGENGCSLFVYTSDATKDGFTEMECTGKTFGGPNRKTGSLYENFWYYVGKKKSLLLIAGKLLGIPSNLDLPL